MPTFSFLGMNFNLFTNPGWVMFAFWFIYIIVIIMLYEDPESSKDEDSKEVSFDKKVNKVASKFNFFIKL